MSDATRDVSQDHSRRLSFGAVAEQYDRARPGYPPALVDAVLEYAEARPGDRILDVGAGTGRATLLFAERGYALTAVEPDGEMAAVASQRAATAGRTITILRSDFETAELPTAAFRALISGTAWHWVTPGLRNSLAARVLVPNGALATFWNRPRWQGNPLRPDLDRAYAALADEAGSVSASGPMNPRGAPAEFGEVSAWLGQELGGDPRFTDLDTRAYRWRVRYATEEYLGLLGTHSDHIRLPAHHRGRLFERIRAAIDAAGGGFELTYETLLCLARRRPTSGP